MRTYKQLKGIAGIIFAFLMIAVLVVTTGYSTLMEYLPEAVKDKSYFLVKTCLLFGADINRYDRSDRTPLIEAVRNDDLEMAEYLLSRGARVDVRGGSILADYPLAVAIKGNHQKMAEFLVEKGANLGKTSIYQKEGRVPYSVLSMKQNSPGMLEFLLKKGCSPDAPDEHGKTPVIHAIESMNNEFVKILLANKADINLESDGRTPLMKAVETGNEKVTGWLVKKGADPTHVCTDWEKNRVTALSLAEKSANDKLVKLIKFALKKWNSRSSVRK